MNKSAILNAISPTFCAAKWLQVTIDLENGTTHSCHHPPRHRIPCQELQVNPAALHNTSYKKQQRKLMLEGKRPEECSYCWAIEDAGKIEKSDRFIKSFDPWAYPYLDSIKELPWDADVKPTYLEVMLDKTCNFSCAYCLPEVSSSIETEIKHYGPLPERMAPVGNEPNNIYLDAFWSWLPQVYDGLHVLRITGGEPLHSRHWEKLMLFLKERRNEKLQLIINSHLCHSMKKMEHFSETANELLKNRNVGSIHLYTSLDTWGPAAEYVRFGLDLTQWRSNLSWFLETNPHIPVVTMCTFNIFSYFGFRSLLEYLSDLKSRGLNITLDTSYLRAPSYLSPSLGSAEMKQQLEAGLRAMKENVILGFSPHEISKIENVCTYVQGHTSPDVIEKGRAAFFAFITEFDRRKNLRLYDLVPELRSFILECKLTLFTLATTRPQPPK